MNLAMSAVVGLFIFSSGINVFHSSQNFSYATFVSFDSPASLSLSILAEFKVVPYGIFVLFRISLIVFTER